MRGEAEEKDSDKLNDTLPFLGNRRSFHYTINMTKNMKRTSLIVADLALLGTTAIWGGTFVVMKQLTVEMTPVKILFWRFLFATLCLFFFSYRQKWGENIFRAGGILGITLFGGYFFQTWGLVYTTPAHSAFITGLSAILVPFFAVLILKSKTNLFTFLGVGVALGGLTLLTLPTLPTQTISSNAWKGDFLTLLGAGSYALQIVFVEKFRENDALPLVTMEMATASVLSGCLGRFAPHNFTLTWQEFVPLLFLGVVATALTFTVQKLAQKHTSATHAGLIFITEPVFAALFSYFFWQERFSSLTLIGCCLIGTGICFSQIAPFTLEVQFPQPSDRIPTLLNKGDR